MVARWHEVDAHLAEHGSLKGPSAPEVPTSGLLKDIADAHAARVARTERERARLIAVEDAAVAAAKKRLAVVEAHRDRVVSAQDALLARFHDEAKAAVYNRDMFRDRVAATPLGELSTGDVYELLNTLDVPVRPPAPPHSPRSRVLTAHGGIVLLMQVSMELLEDQAITGGALMDPDEKEMEIIFKIGTLGKRRRLCEALKVRHIAPHFAPHLTAAATKTASTVVTTFVVTGPLNLVNSAPSQRLAEGRGFNKAGVLTWTTQEVATWLVETTFAEHRKTFEEQDIDGEVLLTLSKTDLMELGVDKMGQRSTMCVSAVAVVACDALTTTALCLWC